MTIEWTQEDLEAREEQVRMIRDSAVTLVSRHGALERARKTRYSDLGLDPAIWREFCEMGWTGLRVPEEKGGAGLGMLEYVALLEELGKGLVPEPLIEGALTAALLPQDAATAQIQGERLILPAGIGLPINTGDRDQPPVCRDNALDGEVRRVALASGADAFLVICDQGLALVDKDAAGLTLERQMQQDGSHVATLKFSNTPVREVVSNADMDAALEDATLGCAAYLLGVMQAAFDETLSYLKIRRQFGKEIGSFQALQHRAVDLKIQIELTRAMVTSAARAIDQEFPIERIRRAVSTARVKASTAAMLVTREAVQFHGGIGYTDEADIGLFPRKVLVLLNRFGGVDGHKRRFMSLIDEEDA
ncbi:acyl-CoA dehydrogenase [Alcanivorax xiamenensis]|uniref:Acyl-CoA dehydrogenase n=1 Tax=Alcanivorax xiamenensis TaxID=1177156 RepID=A0ABQ6Y298_9GAMM|nr:acyl-CoA dehydrogenase family protein [Alcanivorax xiamenensis]KAF0802053.1 acyl-CoA dehydrogenase [Alcanivorax xiamenensis]